AKGAGTPRGCPAAAERAATTATPPVRAKRRAAMRPWLDSQPGGRRRKLVFEASMGVSRRRSLKALRGRSSIRYDEEANNVDLIAGDFRYSSRQRASPNRDPLPALVEQMQRACRRAAADGAAPP